MTAAQFAVVHAIVGTDDVKVVAIGPSAAHLTHVGGDILPIWYREGAHAPLVGDRVATWVDVSTRYVMASR